MVIHGKYKEVDYTVLLKEENRGKRDSQRMFVEVLSKMTDGLKPKYVMVFFSITLFLHL